MKTVHISLSVRDLNESLAYYSTLFGREADVVKPGFAKWWLEDPALNFALNERPDSPGLHHLGIQADGDDELDGLYAHARGTGQFAEEGNTTCCYARSEKAWSQDPQGIAWELFLTRERVHNLPEETPLETRETPAPCC